MMGNNIFYGWSKEDIKLQADYLGIELSTDQMDLVTEQVADDFGQNDMLNEWANLMIKEVIMNTVNQKKWLFKI